jgi:hypothetical protein
MPRANPRLSDYCAARHLLANLASPAQLRRNPLSAGFFKYGSRSRRRDPAADQRTLDRLYGIVHSSLSRCGEYAAGPPHVDLGRIHAVLLRCEVEQQPLSTVAGQLGLSDRQLRRDRSVALRAFASAFRAVLSETQQPITTADVLALRLAQAKELHAVGQSALALAAATSISEDSPRCERRIEALCLAAEIHIEALQYSVASSCLANARAIQRAGEGSLDGAVATVTEEELDFCEWLLRWRTGSSCGLASSPPGVLALQRRADRSPNEQRRALFVRAAAAYGLQRWEIGDRRGRNPVLRALEALQSLGDTRERERLALLDADAQFFALCTPRGAARDRYRSIEGHAAKRGYIHAMLRARTELIACETPLGKRPGQFLADPLRAFAALEKRAMSYTYAWSSRVVAQNEAPGLRSVAAARITETLLPARSAQVFMVRGVRIARALQTGRLDDARRSALELVRDAETVGNHRVRGAGISYLAEIAYTRRRRIDAQRYACRAIELLEQYGTYESLKRAHMIARLLRIV